MVNQEQVPIVLPSELAQDLASYLQQNHTFIEALWDDDYDGNPYIYGYSIDVDFLAKTIQDFYDSLL